MKKPHKQDNQLLQSIKQLSLILKDDGNVLEKHIVLKDNWAVAFNGILAAAEPIKEDLFACPNAFLLKEALSKCGQNYSITQLEHTLSIKSDKFKASIPCIPSENIQTSFPDASIAQLDDRLKASLSAVAPLALDENSVVTASVLINEGCCIATDRKVIIQHYHGISLPPMLALPKTMISPVIKNPKKLVGFGHSKSSCTFHFENNSWFKSQYFNESWPDIRPILDKSINANPVPDDFYNAIEALEAFSENGYVYCDNNVMRSHEDESKGASYDVYGLPKGPIFHIKQMKMIKPHMQKVDFLVPHYNHHMLIFYGENVRGAIAGRV